MNKLQPRAAVIGIDEAQFLGDALIDACTRLVSLGKRVIVAGIDTDFRGRPFRACRTCSPPPMRSPNCWPFASAAEVQPCTPSVWC
jgi:hypothetical protein